MTSRLVTKEPKKGTYETFKDVEHTLNALEEGEKANSGWCWFYPFEQCCCCYCCSEETGSDDGGDEVQCALVNYDQEVQSTPQGRDSQKIVVPSQDSLDSREKHDLYISEKRKQLLANRTFSYTSISKSESTNTIRSFEAGNEIFEPKEMEDPIDPPIDKTVEHENKLENEPKRNGIIIQSVLREWEDVLKYRVVTLRNHSESTISIRSDSKEEHSMQFEDEAGVSEAHSSPMLASPRNGTKSATTSPVTSGSKRVSHDWHEEDLDRITGLQGRASLSTLGARSDSMASVYSGAGEGRYGSVAVRGQVEFGLQYNYKAGALEIQIKQCRDLAPVDTKRNRSDPYVKVYLLPDKSKSGKRKTKVKKHTLNPVFDECLKFHISLNGLETRTLWLTVWHSDMFGRNDFLGEVMMTLENKVFDDPTPKWYNLQERTEPFEDVPSYKGDIIVCLKFVPPDMTVQKKGKRSRGALHVLIKEAKALTAVKANGTSDPFCKSYLLPDKGRSSKQKTPIARRTTNPVWNYTFVYDDVSLQELAERCLELTVWDHDRLASNEFLGGVRFSLGTGKHYGKPVDWMDASGREMSLWKNMLEKPNFWVEGSLSLRSSLESRGS